MLEPRRFTPSAPRQQRTGAGSSPRVTMPSPKLQPAQASSSRPSVPRPAALEVGGPAIQSIGERAVSPASPLRLNSPLCSEPSSPCSPSIILSASAAAANFAEAAGTPPAPCSSPKLQMRRSSAAAASARAASPTVAGAILKLTEQVAQPPLAPPRPSGAAADVMQEPDSPLSPFSPAGVGDPLSSFQHMSLRARRQMEGGLSKGDAIGSMPKLSSASQEQVRCVGPRWPALPYPSTPKLKSANAILARGDEVAGLILISKTESSDH